MTQCHVKFDAEELTPDQKFRRAKDLAAFPVNVYEGHTKDGMTLRDYFAASAPIDFTDLDCVLGMHWDNCSGKELITALAIARYHYADAMLKARDAE